MSILRVRTREKTEACTKCGEEVGRRMRSRVSYNGEEITQYCALLFEPEGEKRTWWCRGFCTNNEGKRCCSCRYDAQYENLHRSRNKRSKIEIQEAWYIHTELLTPVISGEMS